MLASSYRSEWDALKEEAKHFIESTLGMENVTEEKVFLFACHVSVFKGEVAKWERKVARRRAIEELKSTKKSMNGALSSVTPSSPHI